MCVTAGDHIPNMAVVVVDGIGRDSASAETVLLTHPSRPGKPAVFVRCDRALFEIQTMQQAKSSWFLGQHVASNGTLCIATRMDPLLIALPLLQSQVPGYFCPLDQMDDAHGSLRLLSSLDHFDLERICDRRSLDEGAVFRLNDDKVVDWLAAKIRRVQAALMADVVDVKAAIASSYLVEAVGVVCDYVDVRWVPLLLERFRLARDVLDPPKPAPVLAPEPAKKNKAPSKATARKAKRIKADTSSMRSLRSYFAPKS